MNQFLIVCPLLFLAGFLDAIGGGGGLISLPAYLLAGLPVHSAIATNKLSGSCGTTLATVKFIRRGLVNWRLAVPTVLAAMLGSFLGAKSSMAVQEQVMEKLDIDYFCFHDRDIAPEAETLAESNARLDEITALLKELMQKTGKKLLWGTANCFGNKRYMHGAGTAPNADVFAFAAAQKIYYPLHLVSIVYSVDYQGI